MNDVKKSKFKLPEWCLYACVLVAPLRCYGLGALGWGNFSFFRFFGLLMILFEVAEMLSVRYIQITQSMKAIIGIISVSIIATSYSTLLSTSNFSAMMIGLMWLFFAILVVRRRPNILNNLIITYIFSSLFPVMFGLYQYISYFVNKRLPSFPFERFLVSEGKTGLLYKSELRIMSFFLDPSYYGMFLISVILIIVCILLCPKEFKPMGSRIFRLFLLVTMFLNLLGLFTTLSITAFLGLLIGSGIIIMFTSSGKTIRRVVGFVIVMGFVLLIIDNIYNLDFINTLLWKFQVETDAHGITGGRKEHMVNALNKWLSSPLIGVGFGDLALDGRSFSAHNTLLTILGQQGIIGFIIHLYFLFILPLRYFKHSQKDMYCLIAFAPIMAILVQSMGYDIIYKVDSHYVLMLISFSIFEIVEHLGDEAVAMRESI